MHFREMLPNESISDFSVEFLFSGVKGLDFLTALPQMTWQVMWKKRVQHCWACTRIGFQISWVCFLQVSYLGFRLEPYSTETG